MGSFLKNVPIFVLISTVLSETPVFSDNYAKIRYQPRENWESPKAELNLDERHREEVTEKLPAANLKSPQTKTGQEFTESYDMTTESESEQINLARFVYKNIVKDKLVEDSENESNIFDDRNATNILQEQPTINNDSDNGNETICEENTNTEKNNLILDDSDALDDLDQSEISSLNEEGVYYIYHPEMLLQKVVYRTQNDPDKMEFSTHINYKNIAPIVEPIYTYDPRTFVLQRLVLRPQEDT